MKTIRYSPSSGVWSKLTSLTMLRVDSQLLAAILSAKMKRTSLPEVWICHHACHVLTSSYLVELLSTLQACKRFSPNTAALPGPLRQLSWCPSWCSPSSPAGPAPASHSPAVCPRRYPRRSSQTSGRWLSRWRPPGRRWCHGPSRSKDLSDVIFKIQENGIEYWISCYQSHEMSICYYILRGSNW